MDDRGYLQAALQRVTDFKDPEDGLRESFRISVAERQRDEAFTIIARFIEMLREWNGREMDDTQYAMLCEAKAAVAGAAGFLREDRSTRARPQDVIADTAGAVYVETCGVDDEDWARDAWDDMGGSEPAEERALLEMAVEDALRHHLPALVSVSIRSNGDDAAH